MSRGSRHPSLDYIQDEEEAPDSATLHPESSDTGSAVEFDDRPGPRNPVRSRKYDSITRDPGVSKQGYSGASIDQLCDAIIGRDMKTVQKLVYECADINHEGLLSGSTPLTTAAASFPESVELLLEAGANLNHLNRGGSYGNAMIAACAFSGSREIVQLLLEAGADVNMQIDQGNYGSPLAAACFWEQLSSGRLLLNAGARLNVEFPGGVHMNILDDVISRRQGEIILLLQDTERDARSEHVARLTDDNLEATVSHGQGDIARLLANMESTDFGPEECIEALYMAISDGQEELACLLLKAAANTRANPNSEFFCCGFSDAFSAALYFEHPGAITLLLNAGATAKSLALTLMRELALDVAQLMEALVPNFIGYEERLDLASSPPERVISRIFCELPALAKRRSDLNSWLELIDENIMLLVDRNGITIEVKDPDSVMLTIFKLISCAVRKPAPGKICASNLEYQPTANFLFLDSLEELPTSPGQYFGVMLQLSVVDYYVLVDSGIVLLGHSTALIPIREIDDETILCHLEISTHDFQLKRHVSWSDAKVKPVTWNWKGANLQALSQSAAPLQRAGQIGLSFDRSVKTVKFSPSRNYLECLKSSAMEQIVVYDVGTKRAWLVQLISVVHHMLLVYDDRIEQSFRAEYPPLAITAEDDLISSPNILGEKRGVLLEESGGDSLTVRELIMGFSIILSKASLQKPRRSDIYGYEFMDIVMDSPRSELKRRKLQKDGPALLSLLDEVNCPFCSGLGDAIVGKRARDVPAQCNILPAGYDLPAASIQSTDNLSMKHGGAEFIHGLLTPSSNHYAKMIFQTAGQVAKYLSAQNDIKIQLVTNAYMTRAIPTLIPGTMEPLVKDWTLKQPPPTS
ncbi:unnamed protein product [Penicillium pancosmium]